MIWLLAATFWITTCAGTYLVLSRDMLRCVLGLGMLGSAVNLLLFATGPAGPMQPPVVPAGSTALAGAANPLPQALVLTAIVIGFALLAFALALVLRLIQRSHTDDVLELRHAEPVPTDPVKPPVTPYDPTPEAARRKQVSAAPPTQPAPATPGAAPRVTPQPPPRRDDGTPEDRA